MRHEPNHNKYHIDTYVPGSRPALDCVETLKCRSRNSFESGIRFETAAAVAAAWTALPLAGP